MVFTFSYYNYPIFFMRFAFLILFIALFFFSCTNNKSGSNPNELIYHAANTNGLVGEVTLTGDELKNELNAQIRLSAPGEVELLGATIQTDEGQHSDPLSFSSVQLKNGTDTTLSLKFDPFNNARLFQVTGLHGYLKDSYTLIISYKDAD